MDRQRVQDCLEQVAAFRASGQKANVWADANNVPLRTLASWCAHARRWQARLDGVVPPAGRAQRRLRGGPRGRAGAGVPSVRLELNAAGARLDLHWPLAHTRELAALLREFGRMIRIEAVWLALGASDLRGGMGRLLAQVVRGFALGAQAHHAYVFANRRADRLKVLVYDAAGLWLCTPATAIGQLCLAARGIGLDDAHARAA